MKDLVTLSVYEKNIKQAIERLTAAGAKYHIITADGQEHGEPIVRKGERKPRAAHGESFLKYYIHKFDGMEVGDVRCVDIPAHLVEDEKHRFVKNCEAFARNRFGPGSVEHDVANGQVQIMRLK